MIRRAAFAFAFSGALFPAAVLADEPDRQDETPAAETGTPAGATATAAADPALNPLAAFDKQGLSAFRDTPLFTPSRRRPEPPPAPVAEAPPPPPPQAEEPPPDPPSIKLSGVVQGPGGAVAFVRHEADGRVEQLRLGDQIDGWLVTAIESGALKLTLDGEEQDYRLFERNRETAEKAAPDESAEDSGSAPDPDDGTAQDQPEDQSGDSAAGDDVEEDDAPRPRAARPRTQNEHNRRPMTPEGPGNPTR